MSLGIWIGGRNGDDDQGVSRRVAYKRGCSLGAYGVQQYFKQVETLQHKWAPCKQKARWYMYRSLEVLRVKHYDVFTGGRRSCVTVSAGPEDGYHKQENEATMIVVGVFGTSINRLGYREFFYFIDSY